MVVLVVISGNELILVTNWVTAEWPTESMQSDQLSHCRVTNWVNAEWPIESLQSDQLSYCRMTNWVTAEWPTKSLQSDHLSYCRMTNRITAEWPTESLQSDQLSHCRVTNCRITLLRILQYDQPPQGRGLIKLTVKCTIWLAEYAWQYWIAKALKGIVHKVTIWERSSQRSCPCELNRHTRWTISAIPSDLADPFVFQILCVMLSAIRVDPDEYCTNYKTYILIVPIA